LYENIVIFLCIYLYMNSEFNYLFYGIVNNNFYPYQTKIALGNKVLQTPRLTVFLRLTNTIFFILREIVSILF
jgi:hypothetical protein